MLLKYDVIAKNAKQHLVLQNLDICIGIVDHFWTIQPILCMSKFFTNSINQRSNTEKQSPTKIKSSSENEYINGIQKVPQQNLVLRGKSHNSQ